MSDNNSLKTNSKKADVNLALLFSFVFVLLIAVDQLTKSIVDNELIFNMPNPVIPGFFYLHYVRNTGSAFSLFADTDWGIYMLSGVSTILGIAIFYLMIKSSTRGMKLISLAFCLLSAGAIGNLIDRIKLRYVIDFLRFDFGSYTFPIFNFADICAVCGTFFLIGIIVLDSKSFEAFLSLLSPKKAEKTEEVKTEEVKEEQNAD